MRKAFAGMALAGLLTVGAGGIAQAQTVTSVAEEVADEATDSDNGWIGLIGLAGLAGLLGLRKKPTTTTTTIDDRNRGTGSTSAR